MKYFEKIFQQGDAKLSIKINPKLAAIFWLCNQHNAKCRGPTIHETISHAAFQKVIGFIWWWLQSDDINIHDPMGQESSICKTYRYVFTSKIQLLAYLFIFLHEWSLVIIKLNYVFWWIKSHISYVELPYVW